MTSIFWHRRDLRLQDNAGLLKALKSGNKVHSIFIFDTEILSKLNSNDQRIVFIHQEIGRLKKEYQQLGSDLDVFFGNPIKLIPEIIKKYTAQSIFINRDYEPYALERDQVIYALLKEQNCELIGAKDHVIFEKSEVVKADGLPYTIFTPYARKWKEKLTDFYLRSYPVEKYHSQFVQKESTELIPLEKMGFSAEQTIAFPSREFQKNIIKNYTESRNFPSLLGTSCLGLHLRFGTISIRELARTSVELNETYLNELIWRDFYQMIIFHFPHSANDSFKKQYDKIQWEFTESHFNAWCEGKTGYPLVDAGMRQLNASGFMHNRVRMVVASFLTKHLLIDWRLGETYFAEKLLDYELASNVGGWQWAAGCGCDAAPYFRVFNPISQQEKFDKQFKYIRKWVPEFGTNDYPEPIIDHKFARERILQRFKEALNN